MVTVDASVWVNSFDRQEVGHEDSREFLDLLAKQAIAIYVPTLILVEVAGAISWSKQDAVQGEAFATALGKIPNLRLIVLDKQLAEEAQRLAARRKLRGADAVYAAVALQENCTLVTTDKEQLTRLTNVVTTQTPAGAVTMLRTDNEEDDD